MMILDEDTGEFRSAENMTGTLSTVPMTAHASSVVNTPPSSPTRGGRPPTHNSKKLKRTPIRRSPRKQTRRTPRRSPRKHTERRTDHVRTKQK